jgi:predicted SnoaL-like aldol condensation-catalyzing enzyme
MKNIRCALFILSVVLFAMTSCVNSDTQAKLATADSLSKKATMLSLNKKMVAEFYQEFFGDKNIAALDKYLAPNYIQHNPGLPDGREALRQGATVWFKGAPKTKIDIQHLSADGDLVYIHLKSKMGDKTNSVIDIFRIENGKIAEHWDVIQEVPEKSANKHPMF